MLQRHRLVVGDAKLVTVVDKVDHNILLLVTGGAGGGLLLARRLHHSRLVKGGCVGVDGEHLTVMMKKKSDKVR